MAGPQMAEQLAGTARQAANTIAYRVACGLGGDGAGIEWDCPPSECTTGRHRELLLLTHVACLGLLSRLSDERTARAAVAIHSCCQTDVLNVLAAHRLLVMPSEQWAAHINGLGREQLMRTQAGMTECGAGLALEAFGPGRAVAEVAAMAGRVTANMVAENLPGYLANRPWVTAPRSS